MSVLWLEHEDCRETRIVGGKVANLSRLASRFRVPPGFCLTTAAFENISRNPSSPAALPIHVRETIGDWYEALARRCDVTAPRVAVRSSAVDEDGDSASFAGQHETFLNLVGASEVIDAVIQCWASGWSERALDYRRKQGLSDTRVEIAVLVQQLVEADVAAVVFSANPITGNRDEVVVNASWGLGESIVGGMVTPDMYTLCKSDGAVIHCAIGEKRTMTVPVPGGTRDVDVPRLLRAQACLDADQLAAAAELARSLESTMGWPVDVECAWRDGILYLLQCRPITTLDTLARSKVEIIAKKE